MDLHQNIQGNFFTFTYQQLQTSTRNLERKMIVSPPLIKQKYSLSKKNRNKRKMLLESIKRENNDKMRLKKRLNKDFLIIYKPIKMANFAPQPKVPKEIEKLEKKRAVPVWRKKKRSFNFSQKMDPNKYRFKIFYGNNGHMIKRCFKTRPWWEDSDNNPMMVHFFCKPYMRKRRFDMLSDNKGLKQTLNHFEGQRGITDKDKMFKNMKKYLEKRKLNVYDYVPLTFAMDLSDKNIEKDLLEFSQLFEAISLFENLKRDGTAFEADGGFRVRKSDYDKIKEGYRLKMQSPKKKGKSKRKKKQEEPGDEKTVLVDVLLIKKLLSNWKCDVFNSFIGSIDFPEKEEKAQQTEGYESKHTSYNVDQTLDQGKNIWLIKATSLCRGFGIELFDSLQELKEILKKFHDGYKVIDKGHGDREEIERNLKPRVFVIQKYIEKPLLVHKKKFDIRTFVLVTHDLKIYLFTEGYVKLSSEDFHLNLKKDDKYDKCVHLTNLAVQEHAEHYRELIKYNNFSFLEFEKRMKKDGITVNFREQIWGQIRDITRLSMMSSSDFMNPREKKYCFEIFGFDLMIDSNFKVWLIETNTNPGYCTAESPFLEQLFHRLMDDAFKLTLDKIYHPKAAKDSNPSKRVVNGKAQRAKSKQLHRKGYHPIQEVRSKLRKSHLNVQNYSPGVANVSKKTAMVKNSSFGDLNKVQSPNSKSQKIRKIASDLDREHFGGGKSSIIANVASEIDTILSKKHHPISRSPHTHNFKNTLTKKSGKNNFRVMTNSIHRPSLRRISSKARALKIKDVQEKRGQSIFQGDKSKADLNKISTSYTPKRKINKKLNLKRMQWETKWMAYNEEEDPEANHQNMFDYFKYHRYKKDSEFPLTRYPKNANLW